MPTHIPKPALVDQWSIAPKMLVIPATIIEEPNIIWVKAKPIRTRAR